MPSELCFNYCNKKITNFVRLIITHDATAGEAEGGGVGLIIIISGSALKCRVMVDKQTALDFQEIKQDRKKKKNIKKTKIKLSPGKYGRLVI